MSLDDGYGREPALVSLDVLASNGETADAAPDGGVDTNLEGRDESGAVTVAVDRRGRVLDVAVSRWWREELAPSALGAALFQAYTAAAVKALAAAAALSGDDGVPGRPSPGSVGWAEDADGTASPADADGTASPADGDGTASPADGDDRSWLREVEDRLGRVGGELDRIQRMRREAAAHAERERIVSGPYGYVRVTLRGRTVVGVEVDSRGAVEARPERLAADALEAFRSAR